MINKKQLFFLIVFLFQISWIQDDIHAETVKISEEMIFKVLKSDEGRSLITALTLEDISLLSKDQITLKLNHKLDRLEDEILKVEIKKLFLEISKGENSENYLNDIENITTRLYINQILEVSKGLNKEKAQDNIKSILAVLVFMGIDLDNVEDISNLIQLLSYKDCQGDDLLITREEFILPENGIFASDLGLTTDIVHQVLKHPIGKKMATILNDNNFSKVDEQNEINFIREFNRLHNDKLGWEIRNIFINLYQGREYSEEGDHIDNIVCSLWRFKIWRTIEKMDKKGGNPARGLLLHRTAGLIDIDILFRLTQILKLATQQGMRSIILAALSILLPS